LFNFLFLFWPSLISRREKLISGRSPEYSVGFGRSLRRKCGPRAVKAAVPTVKTGSSKSAGDTPATTALPQRNGARPPSPDVVGLFFPKNLNTSLLKTKAATLLKRGGPLRIAGVAAA